MKAVVTGAARGLGWETARELNRRGFEVVLGVRDPSKVNEKLGDFEHASAVRVLALDVTKTESVQEFVRSVGSTDVLVNNAGILIDRDASPLTTSLGDLESTLRTNTLGAVQLMQAFLPTMMERGYGRVVNVSSQMGQLSEMNTGYLAYRLSKTALNAATKVFSQLAPGKDVLVNSVCPGWVKTDMGGSGAPRSLEQGIRGIVWAATLPAGGPNGGFFRDGQPLAW